MSEEKAQRAMVDAARLADELRMEQDAAVQLERDRKVVEAQVRDKLVENTFLTIRPPGEGRPRSLRRGGAERSEGREEGGQQDGVPHQGARVRARG